MNICLCKMTNSKMHAFFREFQYDPMSTAGDVPEEYIYDEERVNAYYEKHQRQGKIHFAIMLGNVVIGDVYLKDIDKNYKCCTMGIHITNDHYKGKGYGTMAEQQILNYAFNDLNMDVVYADTLIQNVRSRRVLEKVGFTETSKDGDWCYYECRKNTWKCLMR